MLKHVVIASVFGLAIMASGVAEARGRGGCPGGHCSVAAAPAQAPAKKAAQAADAAPAPEASTASADSSTASRTVATTRNARFRRFR